MNAVVYHTNKRGFDKAESFSSDTFLKVAEVLVPDGDVEEALEIAFSKTNTDYMAWWEKDGVKAEMIEIRSTSVGDVIEMNGKYYAVARIGFEEIPVK